MSMLVVQPMRWAVEVRPRWIALEQVPAVLPLWRHLAHHLRQLGYHAWCGILSAETFGVPQTRKRAILMASLDGSVGPPVATHQAYRSGRVPATEPGLFGAPLPAPVSMAESLVRGSGQENGTQRDLNQPAGTVYSSRPGNMTWRLRGGTQDNACTRGANEPAGTVFFGGRGNAVDWVQDRPSTTVCGGPRLGSPGHKDREGGEPQFGPETVRVTVAEAGVLQSFRADYPWTGTKTQQYCQVGNCIPPLLAKAILQPLIKGDSR